jgi:hypothetical protein
MFTEGKPCCKRKFRGARIELCIFIFALLSKRAVAIVITIFVLAFTVAGEMLVPPIIAFIDICVMDGKDQQ